MLLVLDDARLRLFQTILSGPPIHMKKYELNDSCTVILVNNITTSYELNHHAPGCGGRGDSVVSSLPSVQRVVSSNPTPAM